MDDRVIKLLDKCEAMSLLCSKAASYWNVIKISFQIPLIFTSSIMCILNALEDHNMKLPNIIVNGISVLLLSMNNQMRVNENLELFKKLSDEFLQLAHTIEGIDPETLNREMINNWTQLYDSLDKQCLSEAIPSKYKQQVIDAFTKKNRWLPMKLNGCSGMSPSHRNSPPIVRATFSEQV